MFYSGLSADNIFLYSFQPGAAVRILPLERPTSHSEFRAAEFRCFSLESQLCFNHQLQNMFIHMKMSSGLATVALLSNVKLRIVIR